MIAAKQVKRPPEWSASYQNIWKLIEDSFIFLLSTVQESLPLMKLGKIKLEKNYIFTFQHKLEALDEVIKINWE